MANDNHLFLIIYLIFLLDLIPLNFICFQMKFKTTSVASVNSRILWLISIINHTVLTILHISMYFHIIVRGVPAMKFFLSRRRPENRTIEYTAVFETVWKAADIYASSFSKTLHSHLHFLIFLDQNVCFRQCIDVLLAFAEVNISVSILQDKMLSVFFPVIFIRIKIKSSLFFHTKDIIQLEEFTLH